MLWMLEPARGVAAVLLLAAYAGLCWRAWRRPPAIAPGAAAGWTVAYASQTGTAQALAQRSAGALERGGATVRCLSLDRLERADLLAGGRFLFVVSTTGEGEAPDNAARFAGRLLGATLDLRGLEYALLALGDRDYRHFCAFAARLEQWLDARRAVRQFPRIDVDRGDPGALAAWRARLGELGAAEELVGEEAFHPWRLIERLHLNPGSAGGAVYQLRLAPLPGLTVEWVAGDLAEVQLAGDSACRRDYSIASAPEEGRQALLLVRQARRADGSLGAMSGWLTQQLPLDATLPLRLRPQPAFRLNDNRFRPLVLIGNGVGLAGLRALLASRIAAGIDDNWLLFGERQAARDFHWRQELEDWRAAGFLARLDTVFSRDEPTGRYVQDALATHGEQLRSWLARGAAIYVCGSRQGMAAGVEATLNGLLGEAAVAHLRSEGRYRRDVF